MYCIISPPSCHTICEPELTVRLYVCCVSPYDGWAAGPDRSEARLARSRTGSGSAPHSDTALHHQLNVHGVPSDRRAAVIEDLEGRR